MSSPSVSVIIPFYNRCSTIKRALTSVYQQTYLPQEVIVIDDGSTDEAALLVEDDFPQATLIRFNENQGVSAARNRGVQHASGDWLAFLDSDDEWLPTKLAEQISIAQTQPQYKIIHSDEIWIRNGVRVNQMNKHQKYGGDIFEYCLPLCVISPSAVMMHRDVFDEVGGFDTTLPACEDYDMWLRVCAKYPVYFIEQPLIKKYGGHEDQLSRKYWGMDRFRIQALHKLLSNTDLCDTRRQAALKMLEKKLRILCKGARKHENYAMIAFCEKLMAQYQFSSD